MQDIQTWNELMYRFERGKVILTCANEREVNALFTEIAKRDIVWQSGVKAKLSTAYFKKVDGSTQDTAYSCATAHGCLTLGETEGYLKRHLHIQAFKMGNLLKGIMKPISRDPMATQPKEVVLVMYDSKNCMVFQNTQQAIDYGIANHNKAKRYTYKVEYVEAAGIQELVVCGNHMIDVYITLQMCYGSSFNNDNVKQIRLCITHDSVHAEEVWLIPPQWDTLKGGGDECYASLYLYDGMDCLLCDDGKIYSKTPGGGEVARLCHMCNGNGTVELKRNQPPAKPTPVDLNKSVPKLREPKNHSQQRCPHCNGLRSSSTFAYNGLCEYCFQSFPEEEEAYAA